MSFLITFRPAGFTVAKYDEGVQKLIAAGQGAPRGRSYHACSIDGESVQINDVWETMEDFQAFGNTLLPIMSSLEVDPGQPDVKEIHNIMIG